MKESRFLSMLSKVEVVKSQVIENDKEIYRIQTHWLYTLWRGYNIFFSWIGKKGSNLPEVSYIETDGGVESTLLKEFKRMKFLEKRYARLRNNQISYLDLMYRSMYYRIMSVLDFTRFSKAMLHSLRLFKLQFKSWVRFLLMTTVELQHRTISPARDPQKPDVFIFSVISYDYRHQRPQHLAEQLALQGHRVFYIENEFIPSATTSFLTSGFSLKKVQDQLYTIKLQSSSPIFIYGHTLGDQERATIVTSFKKLILTTKSINQVALFHHPFWYQLIDEIAMPSIYDCMDDHSGFAETASSMLKLERKLIKSCDLFVASSLPIMKKAQSLRKTKASLLLGNAGDVNHFSKITSTKIPLLEKIPGPIIGYYGAIADWLDVSLIELALKKYPDFSFVFIGRVMNEKLEQLTKVYQNLYLLGEVPYTSLPDYARYFDVCTIPFLINDLIKATDPVKFYEYAAMRKPILTTAIPLLKPYTSSIYYAHKKSEYLELLARAVREGVAKKEKDKLFQIAKENTWSHRGTTLSQKMLSTFSPLVSIVVLHYGELSLTVNCLDSILEYSAYESVEIILVCNGTPKADERVLKKRYKDKIIFIINTTNRGFSFATNQGIKIAKGEWIIPLNNDTILQPGWIWRLLYQARKEKVGLVGPSTNEIGNEMKVQIPLNNPTPIELQELTAYYRYTHWGATVSPRSLAAFCWMFSRSTVKKIGLFDEQFGQALFEDDDYCVRVKKAGLKLIGTRDCFIYHKGSASPDLIDQKKKSILFQRNLELFEQKWKKRWIPHDRG